MRLVADIGGTNTRVALSQNDEVAPTTIQNYVNVEWPSFSDVVRDYQRKQSALVLEDMVVAVAGPVKGTIAKVTNHDWLLNAPELAQEFGCSNVKLLNDLTALGYAVPGLKADQLGTVIKDNNPNAQPSQSLVVGIGTGFNVSPVLFTGHHVFCPAAEAGHVSLPNSIAVKLNELGLPKDAFHTVEDLFSGRGFTRFCQLALNDVTVDGRTAIAQYDRPKVGAAIDAYSSMIGLILRDLSLSHMALSGIYMAGSVARAILSVSPIACRTVFQSPLPLELEVQIPIWTIEDDGAALGGCARFM